MVERFSELLQLGFLALKLKKNKQISKKKKSREVSPIQLRQVIHAELLAPLSPESTCRKRLPKQETWNQAVAGRRQPGLVQ